MTIADQASHKSLHFIGGFARFDVSLQMYDAKTKDAFEVVITSE